MRSTIITLCNAIIKMLADNEEASADNYYIDWSLEAEEGEK